MLLLLKSAVFASRNLQFSFLTLIKCTEKGFLVCKVMSEASRIQMKSPTSSLQGLFTSAFPPPAARLQVVLSLRLSGF